MSMLIHITSNILKQTNYHQFKGTISGRLGNTVTTYIYGIQKLLEVIYNIIQSVNKLSFSFNIIFITQYFVVLIVVDYHFSLPFVWKVETSCWKEFSLSLKPSWYLTQFIHLLIAQWGTKLFFFFWGDVKALSAFCKEYAKKLTTNQNSLHL